MNDLPDRTEEFLPTRPDVEALVAEFEQSWRSGERSRVEDFVDRIDDEHRETLLEALIASEIQLRAELHGSDVVQAAVAHASSHLSSHAAAAETNSLRRADTENTRVEDTIAYTPASPTVDGQFGNYELLGEIARGGMGVVYRARQVSLDRIVAVKMILGGDFAGQADVQRFRAEAEAAAQLDHPNIVPVYDVGEAHGRHFFSMGLVEGQSLSDAIREKPLSPRESAALVRTLALAVEYAHEQGIVHRDLKPGNVLLDKAGVPKITDFGLARRVEADSSLTATGQVMGTPSYMPPEQALGRTSEVGPLADVYSLGAIFYHLLTGRPPFRAASVNVTIKQVIEQDPVPPRQLDPSIPRDLDTICLKCLEKLPERRCDSAEELADELGRFLAGEPIHSRPISRTQRAFRWCRRKPVAALSIGLAAILLLVLGVGGPLVATREAQLRWRADELAEGEKRARGRASEAQAQAEGHARTAADAQQRAEDLLSARYVAQGMRLVDDGDLLGSLPYLGQAATLDSRDAQRIAVHRARLATVRSLAPKLERMWFHAGPITHVEFAPAGDVVVSSSWDGTARLWNIETGEACSPSLQHKSWCPWATFSRDGKRLLTTGGDGVVQIWHANDGTADGPPIAVGSPVRHAVFDETADRIVVAAGNVNVMFRTMKIAGPMRKVLVPAGNGRFKTIMLPGRPTEVQIPVRGHVVVYDLAERTEPKVRMSHAGWVTHVDFSLDGQQLLSTSARMTGRSEARVWNLSSGEAVGEPYQFDGQVTWGEFSVSGGEVLLAGGEKSGGASAQIFAMATGEANGQPMQHDGPIVCAKYSPAGRRILTASEDGTARIWDAETGLPVTPLLRHRDQLTDAAWAADGRQVVTASLDGTARVWDADTGRPASALLQHVVPVMSVDMFGQRVVTGDRNGIVRIWKIDHAPERTLQSPTSLQANRAAIGSNGRFIALSAGKPFRMLTTTNQGAGSSETEVADDVFALLDVKTGEQVEINSLASLGDQPAWLHVGPRFSALVSKLKEGEMGPEILVIDVETGDAVGPVIKMDAPVKFVVLDGEGEHLAAFGETSVRLFDLTTGVPTSVEITGHFARGLFAQNGDFLVTIRDKSTLTVWDSRGLAVQEFASQRPISELAVDREGKRIATVVASDLPALGRAGQFEIWDAVAGQLISTVTAHTAEISSITFSPDSSLVLTSSEDGAARLWNAADGSPHADEFRHNGPVHHAAFSSDGRFVATAAAFGARVWEVQSGEAVSPVFPNPADVRHVTIVDGTGLLTASSDGAIRLWRYGDLAHALDDIARNAALLGGRRIDKSGNFAVVNKEELRLLWTSREQRK